MFRTVPAKLTVRMICFKINMCIMIHTGNLF